MKKLEKLKLHNLEEICVGDQKSIKGGGEWITGPDGSQYWYVGAVEIIAYGSDFVCPRCEQNQASGIVFDYDFGSGGNESPSAMQTLTEFFANSMPHFFELGGHIDPDGTSYIITLPDGTQITGSN